MITVDLDLLEMNAYQKAIVYARLVHLIQKFPEKIRIYESRKGLHIYIDDYCDDKICLSQRAMLYDDVNRISYDIGRTVKKLYVFTNTLFSSKYFSYKSFSYSYREKEIPIDISYLENVIFRRYAP